MGTKIAIGPLFDASGNQNIGATIRIGREICYHPYAEFFWGGLSNIFGRIFIFFILGCMLGELSGGESVAVAVGIGYW